MDKTLPSVEKLNLRRHLISDDEYKKLILNFTIKKLNFDLIKFIRSGRFGFVIQAKRPNSIREVAVKILTSEQLGKNEEEWVHFNHRNILPVLESTFFPVLGIHVFVTDVGTFTLESIIADEMFKYDPEAVSRIVQWIKDIVGALNYLHKEKDLAHCNLKESNVMISNFLSAKLFDFHYLTRIGIWTNWYYLLSFFIKFFPQVISYTFQQMFRVVKLI